jgi:hypothetical protein
MIVACGFALAFRSASASPQAAEAIFLRTVRPMLKEKCLGCHGEGTKLEGDLDLRTRAAMLEGGSNGPALVPGEPGKSLLYQAVLRQGDLVMPPKEANKLTAEELAALKTWIEAGAPWPAPKPVTQKTEWKADPKDAWAFHPVKRYAVPTAGIDTSQVKTPVDAFILQKLNEKGLKLAPPADRLSLLRRVTFDLTGLPPTPEEIEAAQNDKSQDWFERVVERLLASPRYGERWGRHWLDVVRYADTSGYSNDYERPNAWRYRDYVIRSFNADKPYDRFIVEQLAGDELADELASRGRQPPNQGADAAHSPREELYIAVGFLRMGPWEHTGMSVAAVTRQLFLDDVTDIVGTTFLGVTMACCRCHDHKFDPLPTRDYYRLQAVFAPVQFEERPVPFLPSENTAGFESAAAEIQERIRINQQRVSAIATESRKKLDQLLAKHGAKSIDDLPLELRPYDKQGLSQEDAERQRVYRKRLEYYDRQQKRYEPLAFSVSSRGTPEVSLVRILVGGSLASPGETVTPGVLSAVHASDDRAAPSAWNTIPQTTHGRRLALANWIASPNHPLTARVMVNRIWQYHFGRGLVETSNNFGKMGKRPTHPELLDWLATYFVEQRWSVKAMHRLILRSAVYQQSCDPTSGGREPAGGARGQEQSAGPGGSRPSLVREIDPENKLLSYFPPRRLSAEELRDSILAVSGELSLTAGGPGVFPEINLDVALQPRQIMGTLAPIYEPSPKREQRNRRTVYTYQIRNVPNPLLEVFNAANPNTSCERREESTVTPQVFALFNSRFSHDMALAFACRLEKLSPNRSEQIVQAFRLALGRRPTDAELQRCLAHVAKMTEHHRRLAPVETKLPRPLVLQHIGELTGKRFDFVEDWDLAKYEANVKPSDVPAETRALAEVCLVLLNCNEFIYVY